MQPPSRPALAGLAVAVALLAGSRALAEPVTRSATGGAEVDGAVFRLDTASAEAAGAPLLQGEIRDAGLRFDPSVHPADRAVVEAAIAGARPEARALIGLVDGLIDVRVGAGRPGTAGTTTYAGDRFDVLLDLGRTWQRLGQRGVSRLVLHELGHVVDQAVVPGALDRRLDAGIPPGEACGTGVPNACAPPEERFAESFAKWATGDIGLALTIGYSVPPPAPSPEAWGRPLAELAGRP